MVPTTEEPTRAAAEYLSRSDNANSAPALGEAIDTEFLESWRVALGENSSEFLAEVIGVFFEEAGIILQTLTAAISQGDALLLYYEAHALKSSSATLGAKSLSLLCYSLESIAYAGTTAGATEILSQICAEYERVKAALQRKLQQYHQELSHSAVTSPLAD